jgi:hypothetical protein
MLRYSFRKQRAPTNYSETMCHRLSVRCMGAQGLQGKCILGFSPPVSSSLCSKPTIRGVLTNGRGTITTSKRAQKSTAFLGCCGRKGGHTRWEVSLDLLLLCPSPNLVSAVLMAVLGGYLPTSVSHSGCAGHLVPLLTPSTKITFVLETLLESVQRPYIVYT